MNKSKLWIVDFQHTAHEVIKTRATCVEGKDISGALVNAKERIKEYMGDEKERFIITNAGLAADQSTELLNQIWPDPLNDPDPELFD